MGKKKCLVVFYSRTGITGKVAAAISNALEGCDVEELVDRKDRSGVLGYLGAVHDAARKKPTTIDCPKNNPALYELAIIGTPVWAGTMSSAIRTYLTENKERLEKTKKVAFFCTMLGTGSKTAFADMEKLCGKSPAGVLELTTKEIQNGEFVHKVGKFVRVMGSSPGAPQPGKRF